MEVLGKWKIDVFHVLTFLTLMTSRQDVRCYSDLVLNYLKEVAGALCCGVLFGSSQKSFHRRTFCSLLDPWRA